MDEPTHQLTPKQLDALKLLGVSIGEWWFISGRYLEARREIAKLRVSIARIAQTAEVPIKEVPGHLDDYEFGALATAAEDHDKGWNKLATTTIIAMEQLKTLVERMVDELTQLKERVDSIESSHRDPIREAEVLRDTGNGNGGPPKKQSISVEGKRLAKKK